MQATASWDDLSLRPTDTTDTEELGLPPASHARYICDCGLRLETKWLVKRKSGQVAAFHHCPGCFIINLDGFQNEESFPLSTTATGMSYRETGSKEGRVEVNTSSCMIITLNLLSL